MYKAQAFFTTMRLVLVLLLSTLLSACTKQINTTFVTPELQKLRITNSSNADIMELVVLFPGPSWDSEARRVAFGSIPEGQTTEYRDIPGGVYKYAAYEYTLNGHVVMQPVIDWVGESPMAGKKFTYQIAFDPNKVEGNQLNLITVLVDEP